MKPLALLAAALLGGSSYQADIEAWRMAREAGLRAPDGWPSVAGLFWLKPGENRYGSNPHNDIVLPAGPAHAGAFVLEGQTVRLGGRALRCDADPGGPDALRVDRLTLLPIRRGDKVGIRLKDPESRFRREFHGLRWFPVKPAYRVTAKWVPEARAILVHNVLGQVDREDSPGYAVFTLNGHECRLRPVLEEPGARELFYVFRDQTAGKETYGAGRFLYSEMPREGRVVLDFNKAYNPPCAFTPYATCPLPGPENRLPVRIEAGELAYGGH